VRDRRALCEDRSEDRSDVSWYLEVLKNYAEFGGRARRAEYWYFTLVSTIVVAVLVALDLATGIYPILTGLYAFAVFIPSLAVSIRRLHDTGRSGWWIVIALVPLAGAIVLLVFYVQDGASAENLYGPNPKAAGPAS
jgi:uncharacterized membrane protein YhaH (DUF805 family)